MGVWFSRRIAGLVLVVAGLVGAWPATALAAPGGATVFVHSAKSGEIREGRLMLRGVDRQLTWVTNGGRSGAVPVARLHRRLFHEGHTGGHRTAAHSRPTSWPRLGAQAEPAPLQRLPPPGELPRHVVEQGPPERPSRSGPRAPSIWRGFALDPRCPSGAGRYVGRPRLLRGVAEPHRSTTSKRSPIRSWRPTSGTRRSAPAP